MESTINELCIDMRQACNERTNNTTDSRIIYYNFKEIAYPTGEIDFENIKTLDTRSSLASYKNMVIIFNDYFSSNEINGEVFTYATDLCFEIKPISSFWETSINNSFSAEFIILPDDFVFNESTKNTIINLIIHYITNKLSLTYDSECIAEYISKLTNPLLFSGKIDPTIDFTKPIIFKLDDLSIEQMTNFEESDEINQDDIMSENEDIDEEINQDNITSDYEDMDEESE
jgi:hypothetical protein